MVKNQPAMQKWVQSLSRKDALEERNGNPLQYSSPGNPMDRGAWWVTGHGVARESDTSERLNKKTPNHCSSIFFMKPVSVSLSSNCFLGPIPQYVVES